MCSRFKVRSVRLGRKGMAASGLYAQLGILSAHLSQTENRHLGQKYDWLINLKACPPVMCEAPHLLKDPQSPKNGATS